MEKDIESERRRNGKFQKESKSCWLGDLQRTANWNLSHKASGSCSSILLRLSFVKNLALIVAVLTRTSWLCMLGNSWAQNRSPKWPQQKNHVMTPPPPRSTCPWETNEKPAFEMHASGKQPFCCICFYAAQNQHWLALIPNRANCGHWDFCSLRQPSPPPAHSASIALGTGRGRGCRQILLAQPRRPRAVAQNLS